MTGVLSDVYLYKGSEVDDKTANYLIEEIYLRKGLFLINTERRRTVNNKMELVRKSDVRSRTNTEG